MQTAQKNDLHPLVAKLRPPVQAALLFGSVARGMGRVESDIDILQLAPEQMASYKDGRLAVSVYTVSSLRQMAIQGSLFVLHLKMEGQILYDPQNQMMECLGCYRPPKTYSPLLSDLKELANLLDESKEEYSKRWMGLNGMAVFILRSTLFAIFAKERTPCFSMPDIAKTLNNADILTAYGLKNLRQNYEMLEKTKRLIECYLDTKIQNSRGSFDALLLKQSRQGDFLKFVGLHFFKKSTDVDAYEFFKSQADER